MRKVIPSLALFLFLGLLLFQVGCSSDDDDTTTDPPPACVITMETPRLGDSFFSSDEISIRWEKTTGDNVMIELFKDVNSVGVITPSTSNSGYYPWLSPTTFTQDSDEDYSIKVTHLQDSACFGQTDLFELIDVSSCYIKFPWTEKDSIPNMTAGVDFLIEWTAEHTSGNVDIELWYEPFTNVGTYVGTIAEDLEITDVLGSYLWTVDTFHRGTDEGYRLKIKDVVSQRCTDRSVRFAIIDEVNCSIDVQGIPDGHTYSLDEVVPLTFRLENSSGLVDLRLFSGNVPVTGGLIVENFDTDNGTVRYDWIVNDFGHTGPSFSKFNIRAWDSNDEYCMGKSADFTIAQ